MVNIEIRNVRRCSDLHFMLSLTDNGIPVSWDSVDIKQVFMYSERQRGFAGRCSHEVDALDPHKLKVRYAYSDQRFLGIHRVVIQVALAGGVNTYDARVCNIVPSTSDGSMEYDAVIDVPISVSAVDTTIMYEILAACQQATSEATDAADRADDVYERMSGGRKGEVLTKLSNNPLDIGWKPAHGGGGSHPYISLERLRRYLYRVTFDSLPEDNGGDGPVIGGCSSYVKDGKLCRNLDFNFDNAASFIIRTKDFEGMSFVTGLNDGEMDDELIAQLPYRVVDGRNNSGIMVSTHVLFNDWNWAGAGERNISLTRLPFLVLTKVKSMATIASDLADVLGNLNASEALQATGYLLQVLVTDGTTTYAILPPTSAGQSFGLQDITANPKLANFRWVNRSTVARADADLQTRPTGIERFNAMPCALSDLRFTKAYEDSDRLSEFIGIDETTKESTDVELLAIYQLARAEYLVRQRDGKTWQTMHSVVYGDKMEHLYIQEDWNDDVVAAGVSKEYVDGEISRLEAEIPDADEFATKDELAAVEEEIPDIAPLTQRVVSAEDDIAGVKGKIPAQASAVNKLADKAFVNSSVQTAAANFRGNWASKSAIPTDYTLYPADYAGNKKPTTNDYLVIQADESQDGGTWRYKYTGDWDTDGINGWNVEYEVNETPLTAAQLAALNSGVTEAKVLEIGKKYVKPQTGIPSTDLASGVQTTLEKVPELESNVGDLTELDTTDKSDIVGAINEVFGLVDGVEEIINSIRGV